MFAHVACPLFLLPLEWWSHPKIDYAVTSIAVALHITTTDLEYRYWKVKFSDASRNKLNFGVELETHLDEDADGSAQ